MTSLFSKITGAVTGHDESKEQSLTTILSSHEDRIDFLLLLANCIGLMRRQVLDTFDPERGEDAWNHKLQGESGTDPVINQDPAQVDASSKERSDQETQEIEEQHRKDYERRLEEMSSPKMMELKQSATEHFDTWREKVIQRLGEVINEQHGDETKATNSTSSEQGQTHDVVESMADSQTDLVLHRLYPPQDTALRKLPQPQRVLILHSLLLVLLSLKTYTSESRVLMLYVTSSLGLPFKLLAEDETHVAVGLLESAKQQLNADAETKQKAEENSSSRKWKVGLGAAAGAVLIGVTGGLAAPLLAAGVGSLMGGIGLASTATAGYLGALAGSAPLVGALFGAYGGRMTGRIVDQYAREVEDFAFIPLHKRHAILSRHGEENSRHLRVAIGISGYLTDENEVVKPWEVIGSSIEGFALRWELKTLLSLGHALTTYIKSYAWGWAKKEIISRTVFATLASAIGSALALPYGMTKAAKLVDNPFSLAKSRSDKAGKVLAHAIINKVQGERPITLLGYSLGARVIYSCLDELANQKAFGFVESVVLAGAPTPSDSVAWRRMRSVVSGRLINAYSTNDYLLAFLYRTSSLQYGIAGLQPIQDVPGIENVNVSELVDGHTQYRFMITRILQRVGLEDIDATEVEIQMKQMKQQQKREEEERGRSEAEGKSADIEISEMEREISEKNATTSNQVAAGSLSTASPGNTTAPDIKSQSEQVSAKHEGEIRV